MIARARGFHTTIPWGLGPGRFGGQLSFTDIYHTTPYLYPNHGLMYPHQGRPPTVPSLLPSPPMT